MPRSARLARGAALVALLGGGLVLTDQRARTEPPHTAEWLEADGLQLRSLRAGQGDTTVVLIHGYGDHLLTWRGILDPLARDHRVLAFDLPGFGASDKPARPYTLEGMVQTVRAMLERYAPGPVILVGHSMGGEIAAATALEDHRVIALALIAPAGMSIGLGGLADSITPSGASFIGAWEAARSAIVPLHDPAWLAEPPERAVYDPALDPAYRSAAARVAAEFDFKALGERFAQIRVPVFLLWGRADPVVPVEVADTLQHLLPCSRLVVLDRAFHRPQVERPDTVSALLRAFLARPGC